jgi:hypothetical protein
VGFKPTIPVFERAKIFHALYRSASVVGFFTNSFFNWVSPSILPPPQCRHYPFSCLQALSSFPFLLLYNLK